MISNKRIDKICIAVIVIALILTVLFINGKRLGIQPVIDMDSETYTGNEYVTSNDLNGTWDTSDASVITLNGSTAKINGTGAYVNGTDVVISNGGKYVVSGTLDNGRLIVDAYVSSKVWIMLDNVSLNNEEDACIRIEEADKVFITLKEGSVNALSGGESYSEAAIEDGAEAVIFAHDDLTINGSGTLTITANYKHGIKANDDFALTGGLVNITAVRDAIHVNEDVALVSTDLTICAGDDAVTTEGTIHIDDSDILIKECYEGFEAKNINVYSGNIEIYPDDDGFNAAGGSVSGFGFGALGGMNGGPGQKDMGTGNDNEASGEEDNRRKPNESSTEPASESSGNEEELPYIKIYDGNIKIINSTAQDADGLDSNGDIYIYGGDIFISLTAGGPNNAIDYSSESGGVCVIEGGTVIACGSYTMAEGFDSSSKQASIMYTISEGVEAGSTISIESEDEEIILSAEIPNSFSCAILSCPEMKVGGSYLVSIGDQVDDITLEEVSSAFGDAQSSGFRGPMNFSGMQSRDSFRKNRGDTSVSGDSAKGPGEGFAHPGMGERPEGMEGFAPPDMGERPEGMEGFAPPDMGDRPQGMDQMPGNFAGEEVAVASVGFPGKTITEYDSTTILELSLSVIAISAGLIFAMNYRRR